MRKIIVVIVMLNLFQDFSFATCTPVSITTQPQNQNDSIPGHAHFSTTVSGTAPYNYYWYVNGILTDSTVNSASSTNIYNTPSLTMADSNNTYYCIITNCAGANTVTSNTVHLVCIPVSIVVQPLSQTFTAGNNATISFSVAVTGTPPFTYKWYKNGSTLVKTTIDTLGNTSVYSFVANPVVFGMNGWNYHCVISNCYDGIFCGAGNQVVSNNAVLTVNCPSMSAPVANSFSNCSQYTNLTTAFVAGATYSWVGSNGFTSSLQNPQDNNSLTGWCPQSVQYTLTITVNGCTSPQYYTSVFYAITPAILLWPYPTYQAICSGSAVVYSPHIQPDGCVAVANDFYTHSAPSYITGFSGNGQGNIHDILINTGTTAGNVVYTVTPVLICTGTPITFTVTVYPVPPMTVSTSSICTGDTATLTANGATTYVWSAGATSSGVNTASVSPMVNTTYTVTGTDIHSCTNTATATVIVNPIPTVTVNSPTICSGQTATLTASGASTYNWSAGATVIGIDSAIVNPITTTTYTVIGTNICGISDSAISTVTVNPPPPAQPSSILGVTHLCEGTSTAYAVTNDTSATSYTWTLPPTWSGSSDSSYIYVMADSVGGIISVTANNSCGSSPPQSINVYGSVLPIVTVSPLGTVCENIPPFQLTNGNPPGGTYSGIGENSNMFYPYVAGIGTYYITYTYVNGACTVMDSVPITVDLCLNTADMPVASDEITISPNPFTSETTIIFSKEQLNTTIKVLDITGREIKTLEQRIRNTAHATLDMVGFAKGIYFLRIETNDKSILNRKVVLE